MAVGTSTDHAQRIDLHGFERLMTWRADASFKIVHTMLLHGPLAAIDSFTNHLPEAFMHTFNRHPRMRARLVDGEFAVAEIQRKLTVKDVHDHKLLHLKTLLADSDEGTDAAWQAFAREQSKIPFDRIHSFSFELHAWVDTTASTVRLFLFSDHSLSDGSSGNTILNDLLSIAATLSRGTAVDTTELPLGESMYDSMLTSRKLLHPLLRWTMKTLVKTVLKLMPRFEPAVAPRKGHQDLQDPPPINASTQLFATGSKENLSRLLSRCREEETTFFGALTASVLVGFAVVAKTPHGSKLTIGADVSFNMRARATKPVDKDAVGGYAIATPLAKLVDGGVDLTHRLFWDVARAAAVEARELGSTFAATAIPLVVIDQKYHAQVEKSFWRGIHVAHASMSDTNISSVGKYPYSLHHQFQDTNHAAVELRVQSLHYSCTTPFLAALGQFYVTSVDADECGIGYSLNHHYEDAVGQGLMDTVVAIMETHAAQAGAQDSLARLVEAVEGYQA